jgi:hypothetical protein
MRFACRRRFQRAGLEADGKSHSDFHQSGRQRDMTLRAADHGILANHPAQP